MNFTYFHGTSTLFLNSILETGLGTINPNIQHNNLVLLEYIFELCELNLKNFEKYSPLIRDTTLAMVKQTKLIIQIDGEEKELNFKHQGIYVALSEARAIVYAVKNKLGSEILQRCHLLIGFLKEKKVDFEIPKKLDYYNILNINLQGLKPIVLKIEYINDDDLIQENDYEAKEFLIKLRKIMPFLSEKDKYEQLQYFNFRIKKPILASLIKPYYIEYTGELGKANFNYRLKSAYS